MAVAAEGEDFSFTEIFGEKLLAKELDQFVEVDTKERLDKKWVCLYFSAHWVSVWAHYETIAICVNMQDVNVAIVSIARLSESPGMVQFPIHMCTCSMPCMGTWAADMLYGLRLMLPLIPAVPTLPCLHPHPTQILPLLFSQEQVRCLGQPQATIQTMFPTRMPPAIQQQASI
jgi:hypothetical protein